MISWSPETRQVLTSQSSFRAIPVALEMHGVQGLSAWATVADGRSHSSLEMFLLAVLLNVGLKGTGLECFRIRCPVVQLSNIDQCFILALGEYNKDQHDWKLNICMRKI